ncbi:LmeA family phospholipid-binding protein [Streptomyces sp. NPDC002623]
MVDRVATARVESRTAKAFQQGMDTPERPEVHVRGFPVLAQLASGTLRHVDITAHDIPADGPDRPLPVSRLDLALDGLSKPDDDTEALAHSAEATAYLSYTDVAHAIGLEVSQGTRPGRINASVPLPLGSEVTVTATVSAVSGNRVAFKDFEVTGGALATTQALLDKIFEKPIQLRNIPEGLHLRSVTPTASGLSARFSGKSVTFRPSGGSQGNSTQENSSSRTA